MATKRISFMSNVIMSLIVYTVTISLYFIFMPDEPTALFWVNLVYTLFLETAAFGWLFWVKKGDTKDVSPMMSIIIGTYGVYYTIAGIAVMLVFSILSVAGVEIGIQWYIASILVITAVWIVPAFLMAEADSSHKQEIDALQSNTADIRILSMQMKESLKASCMTTSQKTRLQQEMDSIPPSRVNSSNVVRIQEFIGSIPTQGYDYLITEIKNIKSSL